MLGSRGDGLNLLPAAQARIVSTIQWRHAWRLPWELGILWNAATGPLETISADDVIDDALQLALYDELSQDNPYPTSADVRRLSYDASLIRTAGLTTTYTDFLTAAGL
jgi:hypothetical protein